MTKIRKQQRQAQSEDESGIARIVEYVNEIIERAGYAPACWQTDSRYDPPAFELRTARIIRPLESECPIIVTVGPTPPTRPATCDKDITQGVIYVSLWVSHPHHDTRVLISDPNCTTRLQEDLESVRQHDLAELEDIKAELQSVLTGQASEVLQSRQFNDLLREIEDIAAQAKLSMQVEEGLGGLDIRVLQTYRRHDQRFEKFIVLLRLDSERIQLYPLTAVSTYILLSEDYRDLLGNAFLELKKYQKGQPYCPSNAPDRQQLLELWGQRIQNLESATEEQIVLWSNQYRSLAAW